MKNYSHGRVGVRNENGPGAWTRLGNYRTLESTNLPSINSQSDFPLPISREKPWDSYEADVNGSDNCVKVVKRLPVHVQSKWADRAGALTLAGREPTFMDLAGFVEEKALLANTTYGGIVGPTPDGALSYRPK